MISACAIEKPLCSTRFTPTASRRSSKNTALAKGPPPRATFSSESRTVSAMRASSSTKAGAKLATTSSIHAGRSMCSARDGIAVIVASAEVVRGQPQLQDLAVVSQLAAVSASGSCHDHQRQQVLLTRVRLASRRGARPVSETTIALASVETRGFAQPAVELLGGDAGLRPKRAQIVKCHPAAHDEHALVAQRRERAPERQVLLRVEATLQRQLHGGHVGIRVSQLQRYE